MDTLSLQQSAHSMIADNGAMGELVRNGIPRNATMARMEYSPRERGLFADKTAKMRISAIGLAQADGPNFELDKIVYLGVHYNILLPAEGPRVRNEFIYWDCNVIETSEDGVS